MIRILFLVCMAIGVGGFSLVAQNPLRFIMNHDGKLLAVPTSKSYELTIPASTTKSYIPLSQQSQMLRARYTDIYKTWTERLTDANNALSLWEIPEADRPINMLSLSGAYRPFFDPYTSMRRKVNPMALDYDELFVYPTAENNAIWAHGFQETWPGLGGTNIVEAGIAHQIGHLTISAGGYSGRFYTPYTPSPALTGGLSIVAHYQVNDWMALKAWGSYEFFDKHTADPFMNINPILNRTQVGGAMEFKVGDKAGFGVGVNFHYNHLNRRMERQYMFYPAGIGGRKMQWGGIAIGE